MQKNTRIHNKIFSNCTMYNVLSLQCIFNQNLFLIVTLIIVIYITFIIALYTVAYEPDPRLSSNTRPSGRGKLSLPGTIEEVTVLLAVLADPPLIPEADAIFMMKMLSQRCGHVRVSVLGVTELVLLLLLLLWACWIRPVTAHKGKNGVWERPRVIFSMENIRHSSTEEFYSEFVERERGR